MPSVRSVIIGAAVIIGVPVAALAWWLLSPLIIDKEVSEEFPFAARAVVPSDMARAEVETLMEDASEIERTVSDPMPESLTAVDSQGNPDASVLQLKSGTFRDADDSHKGSGIATVYQDTNGARVLRLEDFQVTNGPELHVILTPNADPQGRDEVRQDGYVDLGKLKGNIGNQNYNIPPGIDISAMQSVVIYCLPFHVVFSVANIQ